MSDYPLITIGITCFNAEDTIARAITSAQKQDWLNFEIVVVDDASSDQSVQIIEQIKKQDARIRLYRHEQNKGYPSALNTIVKHAKGEYIAFFDDDDESEPSRLRKQYQRLSKFQENRPDSPILCYSHRRIFKNGKECPDAFVTAIGHEPPEPCGSMVVDFLLWHKKIKGYIWGQFGSGTMMASKKVLQNFRLDSKFRRSAEWDLAIRVALKGGYFISVDEPLVIQHKTRTKDKAGRKPLDYTLMLRKKHKKYLQKNRVYRGAIFQAYARFYFFRNKVWWGRMYLVLACLTSPGKIMFNEIARKIE